MLYTLHQALVCAYLVLIPLVLIPLPLVLEGSTWWFDGARIANWMLALVSALVLCARPALPAWHPWTGRARVWAVSALLALGATSTAAAPQLRWALIEACMWLGMAATAWAVSRWDRRGLRNLMWAAVGSLTLYVTLLLAIAVLGMSVGHPVAASKLPLGYIQYRLFNYVQTIGLALMAAAATASRESLLRKLAWFGLVINIAVIAYTGARGTMLGTGIAVVVLAVTLRRTAWPYIRTLLVAGIAGLGLWWLIFHVLQDALGASEDGIALGRTDSVDERFVLWRITLRYIQAHPWLGAGPMHFSQWTDQAFIYASPHNIYLMLASEWGLPFTVLLVGWAGLAIQKILLALKTANDRSDGDLFQSRPLGVALTGAVLAAAGDALVDGNLVMPVSQVWITVAGGGLLAWLRNQSIDTSCEAPKARTVPRSIAASALVLSQLALALATQPEWSAMDRHRAQVHRFSPDQGLYTPRFWSQGWF